MATPTVYDSIVIGAGAGGLFCGGQAGQRGRSVLILERDRKPGRKILISGGGRCNFTNRQADPRRHYLSQNPHFCVSALRRFPPTAFIALVDAYGIPYHEKKLGQLFCDDTSQAIVGMLLEECARGRVRLEYGQEVTRVTRPADGPFEVWCGERCWHGRTVVVASGGLSIPNLATDLAYRTARQFGLQLVPTRAALVPFVHGEADRARFVPLSGISLDCEAHSGGASFREHLLFTHRGLSGPAMLQISSFWREGQTVTIDLLPDRDAAALLAEARRQHPAQRLGTVLGHWFPKRFVEAIAGAWFPDQQVGQCSNAILARVAAQLQGWTYTPAGTEGYKTAEVTLGGIATDELSQQSGECRRVPGLFLIGEAVDVTGWLGGYNFQWAWASAWGAAQAL